MAPTEPTSIYTVAQLDRAFAADCTSVRRSMLYRATQRAYQKFLSSRKRLTAPSVNEPFATLRHRYRDELFELREALHALFAMAGVRDHEGRCPRVHDIRHAFAIEALRRWYVEEADVQINLPKLALYMGHVSIASTMYYLRWMPAVITQASERFERHCSSLVGGEPS
jgi:integrase